MYNFLLKIKKILDEKGIFYFRKNQSTINYQTNLKILFLSFLVENEKTPIETNRVDEILRVSNVKTTMVNPVFFSLYLVHLSDTTCVRDLSVCFMT